MLHLKFIRSTHLRTVSSPQDAFIEWQKLVLNYTERKLTDYRDKLPAISGVAKAIHQTTGSSYIAGIWADNFSADILWYSLDPKKTMNETSFIAPSFSWASVNSTTPNFDFDMGPESRYHPVAMLTWSHTVPIGNSQFGQIESGFIILKAPLLSTSLKAIDVSLEIIISPYRLNIFWYPDTDLGAIEITNQDKTLEWPACRWHQATTIDGSSSTLDTSDILARDPKYPPCWLLYLGFFSNPSPEAILGVRSTKQVFMVLGKSLKSAGAYERLGLWCPDHYEDEEKNETVDLIERSPITEVRIV